MSLDVAWGVSETVHASLELDVPLGVPLADFGLFQRLGYTGSFLVCCLASLGALQMFSMILKQPHLPATACVAGKCARSAR